MIDLHFGDCFDVLRAMPENSVDALVTDPPYGWSFMSKQFDTFDGNQKFQEWTEAWAREVYRVLKPGAHALIFCGPRTYHRMASGVEDAGFEIRDQLQWIFGSGFPKSLDISKAIDKAAGAERKKYLKPIAYPDSDCWGIPNNNSDGSQVGTSFNPKAEKVNAGAGMRTATLPTTPEAKQWSGFGTALKPANEPILLARKPLSEKTCAANVLKWGCGGLNIDATRIPCDSRPARDATAKVNTIGVTSQGRFPANLLLDETAAEMLDQQSGVSKSTGGKGQASLNSAARLFGGYGTEVTRANLGGLGDTGGASRFFYVAKTSTRERNEGLDRNDPVWNDETWLRLDLNSLTENTSQLSKAISDEALTAFPKWSTDTFGSEFTDQYPKGLMFIIEITTKLITELRTSNYCHASNTKESIRGAIKTIRENGLNLAESAEFLSSLQRSITNEKMGSVLGVVIAALQMLQKTSACANYGAFHPTIKPIRLMTYLCRLITPPNGVVLDPFMGSGSTGIAAIKEGFKFIGIEKEPEYYEIAKKRLDHVMRASNQGECADLLSPNEAGSIPAPSE